MKLGLNRENFIKESSQTLLNILNELENLPTFELVQKTKNDTALVIMDMVNGFARKGPLYSPRVEALIPRIVEIMKKAHALGIPQIAFADCHSEHCPEFDSFPGHCLRGDTESEIVDEIKDHTWLNVIPKNSTNGFLEADFQKWLKNNHKVNNFIIVGDCTDICVEQFALTLKANFNKNDRKSRVIVPMNAVDTFDSGAHPGDLMHVLALFKMISSGVEVVSGIR